MTGDKQASKVNRLLGSNEKILQLLNWKSQYSLDEGLRHTIDFLKGNLDKYKIDIYIIFRFFSIFADYN